MNATLKLVSSMLIFGSMGLFVRAIDLPVSAIAAGRGVIGLAFLLLVTLALRQRISVKAILNNAFLLAASGLALGLDWIFLYEAYKRTTIAVATVSFYTAPVMLVALSPVFLKERLSPAKILCILAAVVGMVLVSGLFSGAPSGAGGLSGVFFGLAAAVCYAAFTLLNKFLKNVTPMEATMAQLFAATMVVGPYAFVTGGFDTFAANGSTIVPLAVLGLVHTGVAFYLFIASIPELKAQSIAVFSYIDPVAAIILSSLLLNESLGLVGLIGTGLVIGSTLISELASRSSQPVFAKGAWRRSPAN